MMACECRESHERRRVVLTGGPGAGKTAVLELIRHSVCLHVKILPEAAGIVFGGGFPRDREVEVRRAGQRAIFHVQKELERAADALQPAVVLCDRGTVDGLAYWSGPDDFWDSLGTTLGEQLRHYDAVIHLRTPPGDGGYDHSNPLRVESAEEARIIDERIAAAWSGHPRRFIVEPSADFLGKATRVLQLLRDEVPACCVRHFWPIADPGCSPFPRGEPPQAAPGQWGTVRPAS